MKLASSYKTTLSDKYWLGGEMMRSRGITVLSVVFGLLTIAGLGDSLIILSGQIDLIPSWLGYLTLIFGITAGGAAAGLWRMKRWCLYLLRTWFAACFVLLFASVYAFNLAISAGITSVAIIALILAGLFLALDKYVSSKTKLAT